MSLRKRLYHAIDEVLKDGLTPVLRYRLEQLRLECHDNCGNSREDTYRQAAYLGVENPICCEVNGVAYRGPDETA